MHEKLRRPYLLEISSARRWQTCLLYSGFVFLFLFVFRPFGLSELPNGILTASLGYGFTTFAVMALLNLALPPLFSTYFSEERWTVGRELTWTALNIALIGLANLVYSGSIQFFSFSFGSLLIMEGFTLAVGIFPVGISILLKESRLKKKYEQRSEAINQVLDEQPPVLIPPPSSEQLLLPSETSADNFSLSVEKLLYIRSADNYVEVFYKGLYAVERKLLRNSLKNIAEALQDRPNLFRCHKSYLVNLGQVHHVSGNAQGYKLHLRELDQLIPVSRQWNEEIKSRLSGTH